MEKIALKELIEFQRRTDARKKAFVDDLRTRTPPVKEDKDDESAVGGDYWAISTNCICNVAKLNDYKLYDAKIEEFLPKLAAHDNRLVKLMYQRNIDILNNYKDFNIYDIRPYEILKLESVQNANKIIYISDFPLYINPSVVFSYERNGKREIGAFWLVPKVGGYKRNELGLFCEMLHRFLTKLFADKYQISDDFCFAVDTVTTQKVGYRELINGDVPFSADKTLSEIKKLF